ncbi:ornithine cyclodeaminase family protein [Paralcaligenes sp. KSB-10]|uniref:ornithine cyclodeaminase family protein n=1 Tax=Paralcaligenes sp. KSB-10 TaxID=2901142 RepID=UPI001E39F9C0|nr:ornithine cyclodeaminase family protein [Paralcaligenes sp. KSB-10]UHL63860.1 ornithine cyclodeaminase family protein [Paralcaligenes sp. KSB-10]
MLLIDNKVVERVLNMSDCIAAQEAAFASLLTGGAIGRPRIDMYVPCDQDNGYYRYGSVEGTSDGILAVRLKSDILVWPKAEGKAGSEQKFCIEPGTYCGLVFLFSTGNGAPLALLNDGHLQHMRVGGAAGIGTRLLSRESSRELCIIGSGGMARTFFQAITAVRDIKRVRVYSRTRANCLRFAKEMSEHSGIEVVPMDSARTAVQGADIVATCTDSMTPVIEAAWLEPGMHVVALAPRELNQEIVDRFDVKIQQGREDLPMPETERFRKGISGSPGAYVAGSEEEQMRLPKARHQRIQTENWPIYTDVISGKAPGRVSDDQITFYYTVGNWGVQFSSVGGLVYRKAKEQGLGTELPLEWFIQDIRN